VTRIHERPGSDPNGSGPAWAMFIRRHVLDDDFYERLAPLCLWLARVSTDGFAGFWREEQDLLPHVPIVREGHTDMVVPRGEVEAATQGAPPWTGPIA
jgi:hypothetical protein